MIKTVASSKAVEAQQNRKREFVKLLKRNLAIVDPKRRDRLANEFKTLILGRGRSPVRVQTDRPHLMR